MRLTDGLSDYGWISIALHWCGAVAIVAMLLIGNSIQIPDEGGIDPDVLRTHTTVGLSLYIPLWGRIIWRLRFRHPKALPRQKALYYRIGKLFHYGLLAAMAVMLVTGPVMAWSGGLPLQVFNLMVPSPLELPPSLFHSTHWLHVAGATVLGWGVLLHILAVIKHTALDKDGALEKILTPLEKASPPA
jgi:cytochrome b561